MGILDAPLRSAASAVIGTFGKEVTFYPGEQRQYDTATRKALGPYADPFTANVTVTDVTLDGTQGSTGADAMGWMLTAAASDMEGEPTTDWEVEIDGTRHGIVRVESTYASDEVAMYDITVRR